MACSRLRRRRRRSSIASTRPPPSAVKSDAFKKLSVNEGLVMVASPPAELDRYFRERGGSLAQGDPGRRHQGRIEPAPENGFRFPKESSDNSRAAERGCRILVGVSSCLRRASRQVTTTADCRISTGRIMMRSIVSLSFAACAMALVSSRCWRSRQRPRLQRRRRSPRPAAPPTRCRSISLTASRSGSTRPSW